MPGWQPLMRASVDAMQAMLGWLGGAAPWMIGGVWVFGALCVLAAAALLDVVHHVVAAIGLRWQGDGGTPVAPRRR